MSRRPLCIIGLLLTLVVAGGSSCPLRREIANPAPVAFTQPPTLPDIIAAVNANSDPVRQLQSESATLAAAGMPILRANVAAERPRRFRLTASLTAFTGPELDLGSNDHVLWFWTKYLEPPGVYFATHQQFRHTAARRLLPIEPSWIIDALGLVRLDPAGVHQGPLDAGDGRVEVRTLLPRMEGQFTRRLIVDARYGWVVEQQLYDPQGQLVASATASKHRFYPAEGVSLPHHLEVQLPSAQLAFSLDVSRYLINRLHAPSEQIWEMPQYEGYPQVNLAQ